MIKVLEVLGVVVGALVFFIFVIKYFINMIVEGNNNYIKEKLDKKEKQIDVAEDIEVEE